MIDLKIIDKIGPTLDKQDKFMFFYNYKVCSSSFQDVERGLCSNRVIRKKQHNDLWYKKFNHYTEDNINNLFKFTIVRNPWSRLVSAHKYFVNSVYKLVPVPRNFEVFVKDVLIKLNIETLMYPSYYERLEAHVGFQYTRAYAVDCIIKMENINEEFEQVYTKAEISGRLPHINKSNQTNYRNYYDKSLKNIVGDFYKEDIERFNYSF